MKPELPNLGPGQRGVFFLITACDPLGSLGTGTWDHGALPATGPRGPLHPRGPWKAPAQPCSRLEATSGPRPWGSSRWKWAWMERVSPRQWGGRRHKGPWLGLDTGPGALPSFPSPGRPPSRPGVGRHGGDRGPARMQRTTPRSGGLGWRPLLGDSAARHFVERKWPLLQGHTT